MSNEEPPDVWFYTSHLVAMNETESIVDQECDILAKKFMIHKQFSIFIGSCIRYFVEKENLHPVVENTMQWLNDFCLVFIGYFISCLSSSLKIASALSAPMIIPLLLFGGFFLNNGSVPVYFQWLRYMSWLMYGNEALSINQWRGVKFDSPYCNIGDIGDMGSNATLSTSSLNATAPIISQICTGEDILDNLNFNVVRSSEIMLIGIYIHSFQ